MRSGAGWLASATPEEVDGFLGGLSDQGLLALPWLFEFWALPHQLPPEGAWKTWVIMGGRGAGKTRAGAEWVRSEVEGAGPQDKGRSARVALVAETVDQAREVMVFGESGILACSPPDRRPVWEAMRKRLVWPNGAVAQVYSAFAPDSLRGPQFDAAWVDELAKWPKAEDTWDMLQFALLVSTASIRSIANVVNVDAVSFDVLIDRTEVGSGWASETGAQAETATPTIERISIRLHELSAMPKASQRLLDDSAFDVEGWLAGKIATRFIRAESAAFVSGDGVDKPKGFLLPPKVANASWTWGSLGYVPSGAASDFPTANAVDCIVNLVYALGADYRANASFVMNSKTAGAVRKMKDADGRFMWSDGLSMAQPALLMGYPVLICEDMPDIAANAYAIAFGDFNAGYTIAERPDLRVLRDPFSAKPHVLFYATKRVGGDISDFAAIKLLKFAVS